MLSKLIAAAESGEDVIIARNGKPSVKLVLVTPPVRKSQPSVARETLSISYSAQS
jgi:antitoxin (DNA-binding transcriptional repressor) of toxin-antitoxin stability system